MRGEVKLWRRPGRAQQDRGSRQFQRIAAHIRFQGKPLQRQ